MDIVMEFKDVISVFYTFIIELKDLILTLASVVGIYVALSGLSTWKKQLKWKESHELAKLMLVCLTNYHNAINSVRNPLVRYKSFNELTEDERIATTKEKFEFSQHQNVYIDRLSLSDKYHNELYSLGIESDALWGKESLNLINELFSLERKLAFEVLSYLSSFNPNLEPSLREYHIKRGISAQEIVFKNMGDDKFDKEINLAKGNLTKYLRTKI